MTLVAAVREEENADLLIQSGASSVITSSAAAGRLLGLATESPRAVAIVEDLIAVGSGLDLMERDVTPEEVGSAVAVARDAGPRSRPRRQDPHLRQRRLREPARPATASSTSAATAASTASCPPHQ